LSSSAVEKKDKIILIKRFNKNLTPKITNGSNTVSKYQEKSNLKTKK
jgi:hypothetical protein